MKIAVIVPTNRPERIAEFNKNWADQFKKYGVDLFIVYDGETPTVTLNEIPMFLDIDLNSVIYNKNDGVRNLGFLYAYKDGADIFISLDDDTEPYGDTIGDHLKALNQKFPISWMNTVDEVYMRGFPYGIREEAECVLSHGVWNGVADFDASTQLVLGTPKVTARKTPVPKGVLFPMCIMNVAFKRKMMPFMYQAPMFDNINRFADIWAGIEAKKAIDERNWCSVTGYATVYHNRASDPLVNLQKEARGVGMNEKYGEDEYFTLFKENSKKWRELLQ